MKSKHIIIIIAVLLVAVIFVRLSSNKKTLSEKNKTVVNTVVRIPVKVTTVGEQTQEISIKKTGSLAAFKEVKVLATTGGTLRSVKFNLGDPVQEGQVMALTDARLLQLDVDKAETNVTRLKADLQTYTDLLRGQAATREKVDQVHQDYQNAENQLNRARKNLSDAAIKAPTGGIVSVKNIEEGVAIASGAEIATIVNLSKAKVRVYLTEVEVYNIEQGQKVNITTDVYPGKLFMGKVSFISPQADQTHNYLVEVQIDNSQRSVLRSGTFVNADFSRKTRLQILTIPRDCITESASNTSVFVVNNDVAIQRQVKTGAEYGGRVQIISGLKAGERIVSSGQINLSDGSLVSISK